MPVVPRIEIPPTIPSRSLVVLVAIAWPPGSEKRTTSGRSVTSASAPRIMARGTGLMAGAPTGRPSPGSVMVPTPSPARSSCPGESGSAKVTVAVIRAPSVQSGSSPASFTTTASNASPDGPGSTGNVTRSPPGRVTSTVTGRRPAPNPMAAALAAAAEHDETAMRPGEGADPFRGRRRPPGEGAQGRHPHLGRRPAGHLDALPQVHHLPKEVVGRAGWCRLVAGFEEPVERGGFHLDVSGEGVDHQTGAGGAGQHAPGVAAGPDRHGQIQLQDPLDV